VTRAEVEDFLIHEAALLDDWRLEDWLKLFTPDATYTIPPTDLDPLDGAAADPARTLFLVADGMPLLRARVKRVLNERAHAEHPRSRTRHLVTNVRLLEESGDTLRVGSNFAVYRARQDRLDVYVGQYFHLLVPGPDGPLIRSRRAVLDLEALSPMGTISFVL